MSFWNNIEQKNSFDAGSAEPLPDGTNVLAAPVEAGWKTYEYEDYINVQWSVLAPDQFKNRRIFQKIKVNDKDKGEKAKRMLAAIDANAGGKLFTLDGKPTDQDLTQCLVGKPMMVKLGLWEINGKSGNWVQAVAPRGAQAGPQAAPPPPAPTTDINEGDIPF
jgi:hypothetical protein